MNDRHQALDLLRRARDIVAERLTERVLANKDEILEDAIGLAYTSEVDAIYEQLGVRLAHLNQLIANLPVPDEDIEQQDFAEAADAEAVATEDALDWPDEPILRHHAGQDKPRAPHLSLPGPAEVLQLSGPAPEVSFQRFATRIFVGDLEGAGGILSELFELEPPRARRCAQVFYDGVRHSPAVIGKAAQLRRNLQTGDYTEALVLLHDCFGLQGVESISVMQTLRARMERSS